MYTIKYKRFARTKLAVLSIYKPNTNNRNQKSATACILLEILQLP